MERSGWTNSSEFSISEAGSEEIDMFLRPINSCSVNHIGWKGFDPVFRLQEGLTITEIRSQVQKLLGDRSLSSAGHRAYFLEPDSSEDSVENTAMVLKIEDWMIGCIPNELHNDESRINNYIQEREKKMYERLTNSGVASGMHVLINRNVESGGLYGQYQFLAVEED